MSYSNCADARVSERASHGGFVPFDSMASCAMTRGWFRPILVTRWELTHQQLPAFLTEAIATQVCMWNMGRWLPLHRFELLRTWRAAVIALQLLFDRERGRYA
jgi:hypothetical protein